jgi:hypothetical protein
MLSSANILVLSRLCHKHYYVYLFYAFCSKYSKTGNLWAFLHIIYLLHQFLTKTHPLILWLLSSDTCHSEDLRSFSSVASELLFLSIKIMITWVYVNQVHVGMNIMLLTIKLSRFTQTLCYCIYNQVLICDKLLLHTYCLSVNEIWLKILSPPPSTSTI